MADQPAKNCVSRPDDDLARRVTTFLYTRGVPGLDELTIEADGDQVLISGKVRSPRDKQLCLDCCRRVAGVRRVVDGLIDPAAKRRTAFRMNRQTTGNGRCRDETSET